LIVSFKNKGTEDIFDGKNTKEARKICPRSIWKMTSRKLYQLNSVHVLYELSILPGNHLELLTGDREGQYSIRINKQYRICFKWTEYGPDEVEIIDRLSLKSVATMRVPTHREPTHPGEMLLEEFLMPMGITQRELATAIDVPYQRLNELVNKKRAVTPSTALRLAKFFGMSEAFWLNLQLKWDLYTIKKSEANELSNIKPFIQPSDSEA